jgi:glycolate oxidase iron-sulfur subunit
LPASLRRAVPRVPAPGPWPAGRQARRVLLLRGCVQSVVTPRTNAAAARVLDELGITAIEADGAGCCGALSHHLAEEEEAKAFVRRNLDAWRPHLDAGAEAVVACASGCGAMLRDYGRLMRDEPRYAALAAEVSGRFRDLSEVVAAEDLGPVAAASDERVALHCPCTLTHALQQAGTLRSVLSRAGVSLVATREDHLCCGSAGTYSLLQPAMSRRLRTRKLEALGGEAPTAIVTANVGCQLHLAAAANVPVVHWIELLDRFSRNRSRKPVTHAPATGQGD